MPIRNVGPTSTYSSIEAADADAGFGDEIRLELGYSDETTLITTQNLSVGGVRSSVNIDLQLGAGVGDLTLLGLAPIDVRDNAGSNTLTGNAGRNVFTVSAGADVVHGGGGIDRLIIDYASAPASVIGTVNGVTDGGTRSVTFDGVENFTLLTGAGDDTITTADGNNLVRTAGGNDTITTGQGQNTIVSGEGNDTVTTGDGGNTVDGGGGDNTITTGDGGDTVTTGAGDDTIETRAGADRTTVRGGLDTADSGDGADRLVVDYATSVTNVTGGLSAGTLAAGYTGLVADTGGNSVEFTGVESFTITTGRGDDDVTTGAGRDLLTGGEGDDRFDGGGGADTVSGGRGADTLIGGRGADVLAGGIGDDVFLFTTLADSLPANVDVIQDLRARDTIDVSRIDADTTMSGDQAFILVGQFSGAAGEATLRYDADSDRTLFSLDVDGDGSADARIAAEGNHEGFNGFVL